MSSPTDDRPRSTAKPAKLAAGRGLDAAFNALTIVGFVVAIAVIGWFQRPAPPPAYHVAAGPIVPARSLARGVSAAVPRRARTIVMAATPTHVTPIYPCSRVMSATQRRACVVSHLQAAYRDYTAKLPTY